MNFEQKKRKSMSSTLENTHYTFEKIILWSWFRTKNRRRWDGMVMASRKYGSNYTNSIAVS